ncbi:MAG: CDP-diacylglycerol--glycerol-3-phosphate 3-phosphatidyltransferase [Bacillota bacterium]
MSFANYLTLTRIFILPLFLFIFFSTFTHNYLIAGIVLILSSLTDFLDGYVARKYNQTSKLGKLLDPLADKVTLIAVFIAFAVKDFLPLEIIMIIVIRELVVLLGSIIIYFNRDDIIDPSLIGKIATCSLYISALSYIFDIYLLKAIIFLAVPLAVISGFDYSFKAIYSFLNNQET